MGKNATAADRMSGETLRVPAHARRTADRVGVSDCGAPIGRYTGPDPFTVWYDETGDGLVLFGTIWDQPNDAGETREVWDAVWSGGRLAVGYNRTGAERTGHRLLRERGVLSTDGGAGVEKMRAGAIEWPPTIIIARSFIPALDP